MNTFYTATKRSGVLLLLIFLSLFVVQFTASGQCVNPWSFGSAPAPTSGTTTISSCTYQDEYNTITGVAASTTYTSTYSLGGCITVTQGSPTGPVVGWGSSPVTWTSTVAGTYYVHYNTDCVFCGTAASCGTTTIQYVGTSSSPCSSITPLIGCGASMAVSLSGTGAGWSPGSCGWSTPGTESIFSFTATASGIHSIDITSITGGYIDFFWKEASSGCSSTGWNCIDDIFTTGNYGAMNWTAGTTYYILLDPEGTGSFNVTFDLDCPNPSGPVTASDCPLAQPVCTNLNFQIDPNGYGLIDELCTSCIANPSTNPSSTNSGCLLSGELNSTWFLVNVAQGGTLEFSFGSPGGGFICYDWIMWQYNANTCANIVNNTQAPVACNWNGSCDGFTGMGTPLPTGGIASNFEPQMTVATGDQFLICFSNYNSLITTVPLDFFGTADISCLPLPVELISFSGVNQGGYNELNWKTGSEINCSHFELERSVDGIHYSKVASVKGQGTKLSETDYRYNDNAPFATTTYYRLKQFDMDGKMEVSDIIAIHEEGGLDFEVLSVYPNPTNGEIKMTFSSPHEDPVNVFILDASGKLLYQQSIIASKGINTLPLDLHDLKNGFYLVQLLNSQTHEKRQIRISKQD